MNDGRSLGGGERFDVLVETRRTYALACPLRRRAERLRDPAAPESQPATGKTFAVERMVPQPENSSASA
jgi:hypothetical protein